MLYNYSQHIKELQDNKEKREQILDKYNRYFGNQEDIDIHDTKFYRDYLEKFEVPFLLAVPEDIEDDFDWDLLAKLVLGSHCSEYDLVLDKDWKKNPTGKPKTHIYITVKNDKQTVTKDIEELMSLQIFRLYEIYVEEQMTHFNIMAEENDDEKETELEKEQRKLETFQDKMKRLMKDALNTRTLGAALK